MGEARRRGTYEERKQAAVDAREARYAVVRAKRIAAEGGDYSRSRTRRRMPAALAAALALSSITAAAGSGQQR
jgi:hypothetical protein